MPAGPTPPRDALPRIAISAGDPLGIGPEICVKALARPEIRSLGTFMVFGVESSLRDAASRAGLGDVWRDHARVEVHNIPASLPDAHTHSAPGGAASFASVEAAIAAVKRGSADAIVTAPISKTSWDLAGHGEFPGHTELLAARFGAERSAMLFVGPTLRVILVTIHVPLARVPSLITPERVMDAIELGAQACREMGIASPRVGVCGLNPHSGEGGLLGHEDDAQIRPAVLDARARGIDAAGPLPADALFPAAVKGSYDLVVAMYHDQGLVPVKVVERDQAVNVTVGLPGAIRTSPAHGTAFDIAGQNRASDASMVAAIQLAATLVEFSRARTANRG